jgi:GNAT superfamily N-acetyltransferase
MTIRPAESGDIDTIKAIAVDTEMFGAADTGFVNDTIAGIIAGTLPDHRFLVHEDDDGVVDGAAYYAPEPFSDRMWNLYFIAVNPAQQGRGVGGVLLDQVERELRTAGPGVAQVLIVETSSTDLYTRNPPVLPEVGLRRGSSHPAVLRSQRRQDRLLEAAHGLTRSRNELQSLQESAHFTHPTIVGSVHTPGDIGRVDKFVEMLG